MRIEWIGIEECRNRARSLGGPGKVYRGLAALKALQIRSCESDVVDSRELFDGHADIILSNSSGANGEPPSPSDLLKLRFQTKVLARTARYCADPAPDANTWQGHPVVAD
jgi:hypothetical protein